MPTNLKGRSFLTLRDFSRAEIDYLLKSAATLKELKRAGVFPRRLQTRNFALVFLKPSCRTRTAFVVAASDEGAHLEIFDAEDIRFGIKESVKDVARVLGRMFDGIAFRGFDHAMVATIAAHAGVPVWNGLCDTYHPTQALADVLTLREIFGSERGLAMTYVGDGRNNQARSLMIAAAKLGMDLRMLSPKSLSPSKQEVDQILGAKECAEAMITVTDDIDRAMKGTAAVYGDVWVSMGEEALIAERIAALRAYKVTTEMMDRSGREDTIYLHCLPALHNDETEMARQHEGIQEVSEDVFEGPRSHVFDQAENRMHTIKALMIATVGS